MVKQPPWCAARLQNISPQRGGKKCRSARSTETHRQTRFSQVCKYETQTESRSRSRSTSDLLCGLISSREEESESTDVCREPRGVNSEQGDRLLNKEPAVPACAIQMAARLHVPPWAILQRMPPGIRLVLRSPRAAKWPTQIWIDCSTWCNIDFT